jgi:anti-sigma factor RsiW
MKDSEFIELLNLYLDHEISAADAARLEAEVQSNADRRRVYQEYCRMQKACKVMAEDFAGESVSAADRKVVVFEQAYFRERRKTQYFAGAFFAAAAACVAVVFISRTHQNGGVNSGTVAMEPAAVQAVASTGSIRGLQRGSVEALATRNAQANAVAAGAQVDPRLAWVQNVQLSPVQLPAASTMDLQVAPANRSGDRTYSSTNQPLNLQSTAFRFQK